MKQCDRSRSPFAIGSSSSLSFAASESDPEDSFWRDFTFDFSFLTSEDQKNSPGDDSPSDSSRQATAITHSKAEESKGGFDSIPKLPNFLESELICVDSKPSPSLAVVSTSHFDSNVTMGDEQVHHFPPTVSVLGVTKNAAVANDYSGDNGAEGRFLVSKDINESNSSPLFPKLSALRSSGSGIDKVNLCSVNRIVLSEKSSVLDDTEVDSPCWRGARIHNIAASGTRSLNLRRSSDDLNVFSRLNPLAPQFIPSSAKKSLDKNGKEFEEDGSFSLKRSLSLTFPPSSGEVSITDPSGAGIEQGSGQKNSIGILIHDADESLGLVSQDSISKTMSILDISAEFQASKKLDPLAPLFVPASAKLGPVFHEKHGVAAHSTSAFSSSDDMFLNNVKVETHSSEADHSLRKPYSNNVHESGKTYSFNARLGSEVLITENTKPDSFGNKSHGPKKLNPLAPQFSLADTKPKGYGSEKNQAANTLLPKVKSSVLVSPVGYRNHKELHAGSVHVKPSYNEVDLRSQPSKEILPLNILKTAVSSSLSNVKALSYFGHGVGHCGSTSSPSPKLDVKKLLTTIHGLSELLTHVTSDSPNEQDLYLINCTVQNLNSYINSRVLEHTGNYASAIHSSCDLSSLPKRSIRDHQLPRAQNMTYSMVSGEMVPDSHFEYGVAKENGYGKVIENHQTEEQINPQVLFYRSLWLKAKADSSLMEYETFLSKTRT